MPGVTIKEGESFEKAFKRFKRLCEKEKIRSEIKNTKDTKNQAKKDKGNVKIFLKEKGAANAKANISVS